MALGQVCRVLLIRIVRGSFFDNRREDLVRGSLVLHAPFIMRSILAGLDSLHRADIVHRDLKPHNVLLHPDGRVVIGDLGVAIQGSAAIEKTFGRITTWPWYARCVVRLYTE